LKQTNWTRILTILLVVLATLALLYVGSTILLRFTHAILIFVMGAIVAYVLTPTVNSLTIVVRTRWLAILMTYLLLIFCLFIVAVLLFTPFVQQSQSLVDNLHSPSADSLQSVKLVETDARAVDNLLSVQQGIATAQLGLSPAAIQETEAKIASLDSAVTLLGNGTFHGPSRRSDKPGNGQNGRQPPNPEPQTKVPPSYVAPIRSEIAHLRSDYSTAVRDPAGVRSPSFPRAVSHARRAVTAAGALDNKVSKTPILLLRTQLWLDQHGIAIDLHSRFGDAAQQLSDKGTLLLDNAVAILSEAANLLLNTILVLIVAFYFLNDGRRLIHRAVGIIPERYEEQVWFFMLQLDKVLGGYIRGQIFLSALAGFLGGAGAAALGVPYPLLIGIMTFLLESVPVMGPLVAFIPPVAIALFFTPIVTTVLLFIWFTVFQQIVTNFLGPKVMGTAVGIHPLEAIAAVLVGYPLGGFLGAFLAVPLAGIIHILVREFYGYFAHGRALPTAPVTVPPDVAVADEAILQPGSETRPAAG
jgi:predicted PurR-regulated permease PerM